MASKQLRTIRMLAALGANLWAETRRGYDYVVPQMTGERPPWMGSRNYEAEKLRYRAIDIDDVSDQHHVITCGGYDPYDNTEDAVKLLNMIPNTDWEVGRYPGTGNEAYIAQAIDSLHGFVKEDVEGDTLTLALCNLICVLLKVNND